MSQAISKLIQDDISEVKKIYGTHLKQVILYGSYARGDFNVDSDVDIMILVDLPEEKVNSFSDELSELVFEYNVTYNIWFMPIVKNIEHFRYWRQAYPFYSNVEKEGISLYEAPGLL